MSGSPHYPWSPGQVLTAQALNDAIAQGIAMGSSGGGASVTVSDTPPESAAQGDLWWNSADNGQLYIYYTDANSSQWIEANSSGTGGAAGTGTVTSITAGAGLSGGTITTIGTISMPSVGALGSYTNSNITVDAQGRVTAASNGTGGTGGGAVVVATPVRSSAMEAGHVLKASAGTCYFVDALNGTSTQGLLVILDAASIPADGTVTGVIEAIPLAPNGRATFNPAGAAAACSAGIVAYVSTNTASPFTKATSGVSAYFTGMVT